jgi:hypothetical protein
VQEIQENAAVADGAGDDGSNHAAGLVAKYWDDESTRLNKLAYYNMCRFKRACEVAAPACADPPAEWREWFTKRLERFDVARGIFAPRARACV